MRLLVVGATGGLGRLIVAEAISRDHEVTALVRDRVSANLPEPVVTVRGDVLDPASIGPAVGRVGHVSRHDLARILIDAAERPDYLRQAIVVGS